VKIAREVEFSLGPVALHLAVDDHSRLAYFEILPDETRRACLKSLLQAMRFFRDHGVKVLRVMTDNGVSFRSHRYAKALRMLKSSTSAPDPTRSTITIIIGLTSASTQDPNLKDPSHGPQHCPEGQIQRLRPRKVQAGGLANDQPFTSDLNAIALRRDPCHRDRNVP
jgi:hypothetical protein